jgi:hypothetical protein
MSVWVKIIMRNRAHAEALAIFYLRGNGGRSAGKGGGGGGGN